MSAVTVLGLGQMGAPIAQVLMGAGHSVTVWNRNEARSAPVVAAGAALAATPAEAARGAGVVITMLTDAAAVDAVLFGPDGAAAHLKPGSCVVQMSTIAPAEVRDVAVRLPAGVDLVDAPVAGSVDAAASGTLRILAGGESGVLDRMTPLLSVLGTVRRCGAVGDGAAVKLVLNTALVTGLAALADALAVARSVGVDRDVALEALASGPLGAVVARVTTSSSFSIALASKDLDLALRELGDTPAPIAHAAGHALRAVTDRSADITALVGKE